MKLFVFALLLFLLVAPAWAADIPRLAGHKLTKPPTIDGKIDAEEWKDAAHANAFVDPLTSQNPTDQTEAWIGYDDQAIYVAFYAHDSKPESIVGREITPGSEFNGEDTLSFVIDPNGNKTYDGQSRFTVNVLNTQNEQIAGGRASKREWRGEWSSATKRTEDGWCTEFRIPWKVLSYTAADKRTMNVNFVRFQVRTAVYSMWANTTTQERPELNGLWLDVSPPARAERNRPKFLAYTAPEVDRGRYGLRSGLDVRYGFTPQFTGLLSINPDFRNIESEIAGIEFTRTERFLDEARPFFNDGGDFFEVGGGEFGFGRMFYSRRIESFDYGAKAYGQISPSLAVGALTTVESGNQASAVAKVKKTFGSRANADVWFTGTDRADRNSATYGFSGYLNPGNYETAVNLANSREGTQGNSTAGDASLSYSVPHWFALAKYEWIPPDFSAPLAYVPWVNRRGYYLYNEYNMDYRKGPLKSFHYDLFHADFEQYDGATQERGIEGTLIALTRQEIQLLAGFSRYRFFDEDENLQSLRATFNSNNRYKRFAIYHRWGERGGEPSRYTSLSGSYRLLKGLDVGLQRSVQTFKGDDRLTILTVGYEIGPLDSISARFVARNRDQNAYLAYRHGGGKGMEYYVILGDPNAERWRTRLSLKVVWAF